MLKRLLDTHRKFKVPVMSKDRNRDTPLTLACARGYLEHPRETIEVEINGKTQIASRRYAVIKKLLDYTCLEGKQEVTIKEGTLKKMSNTPMHWAIYWGDLELSKLVYERCPA